MPKGVFSTPKVYDLLGLDCTHRQFLIGDLMKLLYIYQTVSFIYVYKCHLSWFVAISAVKDAKIYHSQIAKSNLTSACGVFICSTANIIISDKGIVRWVKNITIAEYYQRFELYKPFIEMIRRTQKEYILNCHL